MWPCVYLVRAQHVKHIRFFFYRNDARDVVVYTLEKKLVLKINKR